MSFHLLIYKEGLSGQRKRKILKTFVTNMTVFFSTGKRQRHIKQFHEMKMKLAGNHQEREISTDAHHKSYRIVTT